LLLCIVFVYFLQQWRIASVWRSRFTTGRRFVLIDWLIDWSTLNGPLICPTAKSRLDLHDRWSGVIWHHSVSTAVFSEATYTCSQFVQCMVRVNASGPSRATFRLPCDFAVVCYGLCSMHTIGCRANSKFEFNFFITAVSGITYLFVRCFYASASLPPDCGIIIKFFFVICACVFASRKVCYHDAFIELNMGISPNFG